MCCPCFFALYLPFYGIYNYILLFPVSLVIIIIIIVIKTTTTIIIITIIIITVLVITVMTMMIMIMTMIMIIIMKGFEKYFRMKSSEIKTWHDVSVTTCHHYQMQIVIS